MKPAPFDYERPGNVNAALSLLHEAGDTARLLAGGQSLLAMLNMRVASPELIIDISRMPELSDIQVTKDDWQVGASVTQATLQQSTNLQQHLPLLALALPYVGHYQTRSRGTVCGSLCHADPSSELPLCLAVLGGCVELRSSKRSRILTAQDFQTGMLSTATNPDELMVTSRWPIATPGQGFAFHEMAMRRGDFAIVAIAAVVDPNGIRLGVGGVADRPHVVHWPLLEGSALDDALNELAWSLPADSDQHATAQYRRKLVRHLGRRTVEAARKAIN